MDANVTGQYSTFEDDSDIIKKESTQLSANMSNWRSTQHKLVDKLHYVMFNGIMTDITFIVGQQKDYIQAHKLILSVGSTVFEAMFHSLLANSASIIEVPDIEPAAFRNLLNFLYTDEVELELDSVMCTLYAARKYAVLPLEERCVLFLEASINIDNAFVLLSQARFFDVSTLTIQCLELIDIHTEACIKSESFIDIDNDTLESVLSRDTLMIKESVLYDAVIKWSEAECVRKNLPINSNNQLKVLKKCANLIRYPLMKSEEFAAGPAQNDLLTVDQKLEFFISKNLNSKTMSDYSDKPRSFRVDRQLVCKRFLEVGSKWGYSGTSDTIFFKVTRRVFITGFGLYGSISGPSQYYAHIKLVRVSTKETIASNETQFNCDGSSRTFPVKFTEPVEVLPHEAYHAIATLKGTESFYGMKGLQKVDCENGNDSVTFLFKYANDANNGTSVEEGQIPEITFCL